MTERDLILNESRRVHAKGVTSDFEFHIMGDMIAWCADNERWFSNTEDMIAAYWNERLN